MAESYFLPKANMQNSVNTKLLYTNIFPQSGC